MKRLIGALATVVIGFGLAAPANAVVYNLTNLNSQLDVDTNTGFINWIVDGTNHLFLEQYYARIGAGAAVLLVPVSADQVSARQIDFVFNVAGYGTIEMSHRLNGAAAGSNQSGWSTSVQFLPAAGAGQLNFYTYTDFDIGGTPGGDTVTYLGLGQYIQTDPTSPGELNRWGANRTPTHCQANFFPIAQATVFGGDLNDSCSLGTDDVVFSNQWTDPVNMSIDRSIVRTPEPGTLMLLGLGLLGLGGMGRRRA